MTEHQSVEIGELLGVNAVIAPLDVAVPVPVKLSHLSLLYVGMKKTQMIVI